MITVRLSIRSLYIFIRFICLWHLEWSIAIGM